MVKMGDFSLPDFFQMTFKLFIGLKCNVFESFYKAKVLLIDCQREARLP